MTYVAVDLGYVSNKDLQSMKRNAHAITTGFLGLNPQDIFAVVYDALDRTVNYRQFNPKDPTQVDLAAVPYKNLMATLLMESAHDLGVSDIRDAPIFDVKRPFTTQPKCLREILRKIDGATASVDLLSGYSEEWGLLRKPVVYSLIKTGILGHIPGPDKTILTGPAIDVDYERAEKEMKALEEKLMGKPEETFQIHTLTGSRAAQYELVIECPGDSNEVSARPDRNAPPSTKKRWANVPTLELFRYAVGIKGTYPKTKAYGDILINLYLDEIGRPPHPLVLHFKHGVVEDYYFVEPKDTKTKLSVYSREDLEFLRLLNEFFTQYPGARTFAEDADGFNEKARIFYRGKPVRTVEAEKVKWVKIDELPWRVSHIAVGDNSAFGGSVTSNVHKDMLYTAFQRFAEKDGEEIPIIKY
jgi:hypothetical protein